MKAPDKIHITEGKNNCGILTGFWHSIGGAMIKTEEYIRKEAILEWAKEIAENASWVSIDAVVNKIESL